MGNVPAVLKAYSSRMASKTSLTASIRQFDVKAAASGLAQNPDLLSFKDERGRNWLHLTASISIPDHPDLLVADSIALARHLLDLGLPINGAAFTEGTWAATPLWYAVSRGRNLPLATWLLESGSTPEHCLWAAAFRDDAEMLQLLISYGAPLEAVAEGETPLLGAIKVSRFESAGLLLAAGANPDYVDSKGMTGLHYMLKKGSDPEHFELLARHGARGDIPGPDGRTAIEILARKRSPGFKTLAERFSAVQ